jgi:Transposase DDE domain
MMEPVFANIRHNKQLNRFTLGTQSKVKTQRTLYCWVHHIEKLSKTRLGCYAPLQADQAHPSLKMRHTAQMTKKFNSKIYSGAHAMRDIDPLALT